MSLNHSELGYLVKQLHPSAVSNLLMSEASDSTDLFTVTYNTFMSFMKIVTKKLRFKVRKVYVRPFKCVSELVF